MKTGDGMKYLATLRGGPCDGEVVEVKATCYRKCVTGRRAPRLFFHALYKWAGTADHIEGHFVGYFDGTVRVRKDGSRMPKKKVTG